MSADCGDEIYFMTQTYFYSETDWNPDSLIAFLSANASDQCRDEMCLTMDQTGFPCPSSQVARKDVEFMPALCKWQMWLSSQVCIADDTVTDADTLVSCMEENLSEDCHDNICGVMADTGEPCPVTPVGNIDISIKQNSL